jgi:hypothetical protein
MWPKCIITTIREHQFIQKGVAVPSFTIRQLTPADAADFRAIRLAALQNAQEAFGSTYEMEAARALSGWEERLQMPGVLQPIWTGRSRVLPVSCKTAAA